MKAPFSWPKISLSMRVSGIAAQLMATNGLFLRGEELVDGAGDQLLAGAALAGDEDRSGAGRDELDEVEDLLHLARGALERAEFSAVTEELAGCFELAIGAALTAGVLEDGAQAGRVDGLFDEVIGAQLHGGYGGVDRALGGEQDEEISCEVWATRWSNSMPFMPGILRSLTTMPGVHEPIFSSPSSPFCAVSVL